MSERGELAEFLRARRERLQPADVGIRVHGHRRTPGLRREEVATLAGVSIDYLVRLEQGRDTNPSAEVITALADALRLNDSERRHLGLLVAHESTPNLCPSRGALATDVRPTVQTLLDRLAPSPAFVLGPLNDVVAWNEAWALLMTGTGLLDGTPPNLARYVFTDARARQLFADWDAAADEQAAQLRWVQPRWGTEPRFAALVAELDEVPEFRRWWDPHPVDEKRPGTKRLHHPTLGDLHIAFEVLSLTDDEQRIVTWLAADAPTEQRLTAMFEQPVSPAKLRVVGED